MKHLSRLDSKQYNLILKNRKGGRRKVSWKEEKGEDSKGKTEKHIGASKVISLQWLSIWEYSHLVPFHSVCASSVLSTAKNAPANLQISSSVYKECYIEMRSSSPGDAFSLCSRLLNVQRGHKTCSTNSYSCLQISHPLVPSTVSRGVCVTFTCYKGISNFTFLRFVQSNNGFTGKSLKSHH